VTPRFADDDRQLRLTIEFARQHLIVIEYLLRDRQRCPMF
jgi:hypothetical protein